LRRRTREGTPPLSFQNKGITLLASMISMTPPPFEHCPLHFHFVLFSETMNPFWEWVPMTTLSPVPSIRSRGIQSLHSNIHNLSIGFPPSALVTSLWPNGDQCQNPSKTAWVSHCGNPSKRLENQKPPATSSHWSQRQDALHTGFSHRSSQWSWIISSNSCPQQLKRFSIIGARLLKHFLSFQWPRSSLCSFLSFSFPSHAADFNQARKLSLFSSFNLE
jgi:hypothetical protein